MAFGIQNTAKGIQNPNSSNKNCNPIPGIHGKESRMQDRFAFTYMSRQLSDFILQLFAFSSFPDTLSFVLSITKQPRLGTNILPKNESHFLCQWGRFQETIKAIESNSILGLCHGVFKDRFMLRYILQHFFPPKWQVRCVYERHDKQKIWKRERKKERKRDQSSLQVLLTGLWDLEDILNLHKLKLETCNLNEIFGGPLG